MGQTKTVVNTLEAVEFVLAHDRDLESEELDFFHSAQRPRELLGGVERK
jgi:hypothetical protein